MKDDDLRRLILTYQNKATGVFVYRGELLTLQLPVAIKDQYFSSVEDANTALEEALNHTRLIHQHVVRIYDMGMSQKGDHFVISLAIELLAHDLQQEIETRHDTSTFWTEHELWVHFSSLVDALALAQRTNICHRDIKPQNIFVESSGLLKIGDFGSSKQCLGNPTVAATLQGSPYYLSPLLKRRFLAAYCSRGCAQESDKLVAHNVFKSDVFSLGLTFMHMAKLEASRKLTALENLKQIVCSETDTLDYSPGIKTLLQLMLEEEESKRMDFLQLQQYIRSQFSEDHLSLVDTTASTGEVDPALLLSQFNQDQSPESLQKLFDFSVRMTVEVRLQLQCHVCKNVFTLDITKGCTAVENLFFCSQTCYVKYSVEVTSKNESAPDIELPPPEREREQDVCNLCYKRRASLSALGVCKKCEAEHIKATEKLKSEECVQCGKRWPKQSEFANLFRKHVSGIQLQTCKHKLCSQACLLRVAEAGRRCPRCSTVVLDQFLKFMKVI